jgi:hypothetical protein
VKSTRRRPLQRFFDRTHLEKTFRQIHKRWPEAWKPHGPQLLTALWYIARAPGLPNCCLETTIKAARDFPQFHATEEGMRKNLDPLLDVFRFYERHPDFVLETLLLIRRQERKHSKSIESIFRTRPELCQVSLKELQQIVKRETGYEPTAKAVEKAWRDLRTKDERAARGLQGTIHLPDGTKLQTNIVNPVDQLSSDNRGSVRNRSRLGPPRRLRR